MLRLASKFLFVAFAVGVVACSDNKNGYPTNPNFVQCPPGQTVLANGQPCNTYGTTIPSYPNYGPNYPINYNNNSQYTYGSLPYVWWNNGSNSSYVSSNYYWQQMWQYYAQTSYYNSYGSQYWYFYQWYRSSPYCGNTMLYSPSVGYDYPIADYLDGYNSYYGYNPGSSIAVSFSFLGN